MKGLYKSVIGILIAIALLMLGLIFAAMTMTISPQPACYLVGLVSLSFMFLFFRWLVFLVHKK